MDIDAAVLAARGRIDGLIRQEMTNFQVRPLELFSVSDNKVLGCLRRIDVPIPTIPGFPTSRPSLLLYDLDTLNVQQLVERRSKGVYQYIEATRWTSPGVLYGTSGAGKTRSVLEYLSLNYGIYLTCVSERNLLLNAPKADPGSADLREVLDDLVGISDQGGSNNNLLRVKTRLQLLLFIRSMVFLAVKEVYNNLTPYEWLLMQLYPNHYFGKDIFYEVFRRCKHVIDTSTMDVLFLDHEHEWAAIFVDEAQVLLNDKRGFFLRTEGDKRSSFSGIFKGLLKTRLSVADPTKFPFSIFAGTGMSMEGLEKEKTSGNAKFAGTIEENSAFVNFLPLAGSQVDNYLSTFLQLENVDENVRRHVTSWLRGRPRWAATFVEEYLVRTDKSYKEPTKGDFTGGDALIQAIDRYIHDMTSKLSDRRKSWQGGNRTACSAFEEFDAENKNRKHRRSLNEIERAIYKYAFGMKPDLLKEDAKILIMTGVAALHVRETNMDTKSVVAYIDEPLMVEAGVRYYGVDELL